MKSVAKSGPSGKLWSTIKFNYDCKWILSSGCYDILHKTLTNDNSLPDSNGNLRRTSLK